MHATNRALQFVTFPLQFVIFHGFSCIGSIWLRTRFLRKAVETGLAPVRILYQIQLVFPPHRRGSGTSRMISYKISAGANSSEFGHPFVCFADISPVRGITPALPCYSYRFLRITDMASPVRTLINISRRAKHPQFFIRPYGRFCYFLTSFATHSTCTVLGKRSTAVNFSTL